MNNKYQSNKDINDQEFLEEYFEICKRVWLDMETKNTWPWETDSPNPANLLESKDNRNNPQNL